MNFYLAIDQKTLIQCSDIAQTFCDHISLENLSWINAALINLPEYICSICSTDPTVTQKVIPHPDFFLILFKSVECLNNKNIRR